MLCRDIGPTDADVVLVGEAPGEDEEREGVPFVGAAGRMLKQMLSHCCIDYNKCFVTNVMNVRPPGNKFKHFYEGKLPTRQLEDAQARLGEKIANIKPKVIIPLGAEPLKAVCNKHGIGKWRGTWLSFRGINVLPTYHPSYVMRVYKEHPIVELDLSKAVNNEPAKLPNITLSPSIEEVMAWLYDCRKYSSRASFDIETVGKSVRCIGFARRFASTRSNNGDIAAISIPLMKFASSDMLSPLNGSTRVVKTITSGGLAGSYWSAVEEVKILDAIQVLFSSGIEIVGQNSIGFDSPLISNELLLSIKNHYMDTMHAWHCMYPEFPKSLDFLCSVLTDYPNYWTEKDTQDDMSEWRYNAMDCAATLVASEKIEAELREVEI